MWLKGGKKENQKKNQVRAISALESSLSKKIMKWEKGRNMPCGSQKDKRKHQSLANKKQTMITKCFIWAELPLKMSGIHWALQDRTLTSAGAGTAAPALLDEIWSSSALLSSRQTQLLCTRTPNKLPANLFTLLSQVQAPLAIKES